MAGGPFGDGCFSYEAHDSGGPKGDLLIYGGLIQQTHGPVGNFNIREGVLLNGYRKHYQRDNRMMTNPPPFFPATGRYRILYWKDLR
ncbi:MAG: hypothetical protein HYU64_15735 [Armatimonadetes bacterium]|nr:hypothetical protein [Armatimonadota bacterium]